MVYKLLHIGVAIVVFISFLSGSAHGQLRVSPNATTFTKSIGDKIVFTCYIAVDQIDVIVNIQWFDPQNNEILDKTPGRDNTPYVDKSQPLMNKLYITNIQSKHAGIYQCKAIVEGNLQVIPITLTLNDGVSMEAPTPQFPIGFTDALIQCRVYGNPIPTVFWRFRGQRIVTGSRYMQDQYGLRVRNISLDDKGLYACCAEVESTGFYDERTIDVIVYYKPKIIKGPSDARGIQSQQYTLECHAEGVPNPKYEFFKDGNHAPVFSTPRIGVDGDLGVINFWPLYEDDQGSYQCHAFNAAGDDFSTGYLTVLVPPTIYNIKNVTQPEGQATTLTCLSYGNPPPNMVYRKAGNMEDYVMGPNEGGRIVLSNPVSGQLNMLITNLVPDDTANYTCKSTNAAGFHEKNGTVTVEFAPLFWNSSQPVVYNWAGKSRNLTCHVRAEPMPLIEWVRYGRVIQNNETYRTYVMSKDSNLQVTVREVDEGYIYGVFTCRARNQYGVNTFNVTMKRAALPGPPYNATVKEATPTTVLLDIQPPLDTGGVKIFGYNVQHLTKFNEFFLGEPFFIEYLSADYRYQFMIRARSEVGLGQPFMLVYATPPATAPYKLKITSDPRGSWPYQYIVTWEKPFTGGLPIREYDFMFRRMKRNDDPDQAPTPLEDWTRRVRFDDIDNPMMYYLLDDLSQMSYYELQVRAMNDIGWSPPSDKFYFNTVNDPLYESSVDSGPSALRNPCHFTAVSVAVFSTAVVLLRAFYPSVV